MKIEKIRKDKKISQKEIADYLWISRQTYSKLENWETEFTLWQIVKVSEYLWMDIWDVFEWDFSVVWEEKVDWEKYKQIITNFIKYWADCDWKITKTKLAKLCYLLDFAWYYHNLKSLTWLDYIKLPQWPVPYAYFSTLEELQNEEAIDIKDIGRTYLIKNIENPKDDKLSNDELILLKKIALKWKWKNTKEIVEFTHKQLPWTICYEREKIPYSLITQENIENVY